ncbi:MAG: hypothetical protein F9K19_01520 [Rhizobiaceae bacterium]|nr:MAG: hypothetical protein F9K19_01520 [Rhizobiaceae bacterium]CAG1011046.1 hypothetical protein RHIZO_03908 [Rhizobiaceae bacterium]
MRRTPEKGHGDTVAYLHAMLGELRDMAEAERFDMLAYLIDMAYTEAGDIIRGRRPSRLGKQERNGTA